MLQAVLFVHRYLAVAVGLLMTLWCLSGFVMMYQGMPALDTEQRLQGLQPLNLEGCCDPALFDVDDDQPAPQFRIEMLLGEPVIRVAGSNQFPLTGTGPRTVATQAVYLRTGQPVTELTSDEVLQVARLYGQRHGIEGAPRSLGIVDIDQWTLQTARRNQPAYRIAFDDRAGHQIYVSGATGEIFQATNRRERTLAWLGAIPHWLYPMQLRQNGALWSEIVIWTSLIGSFLAATGLYVGIARFRRRGPPHKVRYSPFRGWWYWHHITGLVFGVLVLTWVFSGLMTMNPWGALTGGPAGQYRAQMTGTADWGELKQLLASLDRQSAPVSRYAELQSAVFGGRLHVVAMNADGERLRLDASARPAPLQRPEVESAIARIDAPLRELTLMEREDSYYYGHKRDVELPVYRAILDDDERTRLYVTPSSGGLSVVGATARTSRWIRTGLHDLDFAGLRIRPIWDVVVIALLIGVTLVCMTGTWLAFKRVRLDFLRLRLRLLRLARRAMPQAATPVS